MTVTARTTGKPTPQTGDQRVRIIHDDAPENPRTAYSNLGELISFNRHFGGDRSRPIEDWTAREFFAEIEEPQVGDLLIPIDYQDYGSGGVRLSVQDEITDRTDAVLLIDAATVAQWGEGQAAIDQARTAAEGEIEQYEQWMNGNVYGFVIERCDVCSLGHAHWSHVDSCWGFYTLELDTNGMLECIPAELHAAARKAAESPEYGR